jgi:hypothetical protein
MSTEEASIWQALQRLERQILGRGQPPGHPVYDPRRSVDWFDELQVRFDRVRRVRAALDQSGPMAHRLICERLAGIELGMIADVLIAACKDVALYCGGSMLVGTAAGASLGALAGGVGAVPGAAAGAMVGAQAGMWVLGLLGLKSLIEDLGTAIPAALRHYQQGVQLAWGSSQANQAAQPPMDAARAPHEIAQGHVLLIAAMLTALVAYLTRGRGRGLEGRAQVLKEIRESRRLGPKVADWVETNEQKLLAHPHLKPREQQVSMQSAAPAPAATPSQLKARQQAVGVGDTPKPAAAAAAAAQPAKDYGVAFFGDSNLGYYTRDKATIGRDGKSFFFMPAEDSAVVKNAADAARYTGRAPSAEAAYLQGGDIYGLSFPTTGMQVRPPTAADAGGWPHFLEGGHTAVKLGDGPGAGYLVNPTREFVIPGGQAVPEGSVLFKLGPDGEWQTLRKF